MGHLPEESDLDNTWVSDLGSQDATSVAQATV